MLLKQKIFALETCDGKLYSVAIKIFLKTHLCFLDRKGLILIILPERKVSLAVFLLMQKDHKQII